MTEKKVLAGNEPLPKAAGDDFLGRFREILSDPLNLLIERHPRAGAVEGDLVVLHNGHKVPFRGPGSYYGEFSSILVINRGVHEPLEEFVFQQLLKRLPRAPQMIELGAYWGHYSMWLKLVRPEARVVLVEPSPKGLAAGQVNFKRNGYAGDFILASVGTGQFEVDGFLAERGLDRLDVLHSDIQGAEGEMIEGAMQALKDHRIDYLVISTHNGTLHAHIGKTLEDLGYRLEVSSDPKLHTTAFDGLLFASNPALPAVLRGYEPLGRLDIPRTSPGDSVARLARMAAGLDEAG